MLQQFFAHRLDLLLDPGQLRMGVAVPRDDLLSELLQARQFGAHVFVMRGDDVATESTERGSCPIRRGIRTRFTRNIDGRENGLRVKGALPAGFGERLAPAAAVINAEFLEDTDGSGLFDGDVADRSLRGVHRNLLLPNLPSRKTRRCDISHSEVGFVRILSMPEPGKVISALGSVALFAGLSPEEIRMLAARTVAKHVATGELLFSEGDACKGLYVIASGKLRIFKSSVSGREQVLAVEGPGGSVAELPVFDGGPYPASVSAVEDSQVLFISREDFRRFCLERPEVALKMLAVVGSRLRRLVGIIEELSFATVRQRLVAVLVRMAESEGKRSERGIDFQLPGTHQDLAQQLGTVRELVSRNLMRLQAEGLLQVEGRSITVLNLPGLAAITEGNG